MAEAPRWGLVSTIKAPLAEIEAFAAHHLDLGAHRLFLYLDDADTAKAARLKAHPKIRVTACDGAYWRRSHPRRPARHQVRQSLNATHAYRRAGDVDWLAHVDVDEFLWPGDVSLSRHLAGLPPEVLVARVRPVEALAGGPETGARPFKAFALPRDQRARETRALYPCYGDALNGGFLSHVAGKVLLRTGQDEVELRIHNAFVGGRQNPGMVELDAVRLCHLHATDAESWLAAYRFRHARGAYRAELAPNRSPARGGVTLHEVLAGIEAEAGEDGLRAFFREVCTLTPELRAGLEAQGRLVWADLDLEAKRARHFLRSSNG